MATVSGVGLGATGAGAYPAAVGASYAGDPTHVASSGTGDLSVAAASSTTTMDCPASVTFTGEALEPCTGSVTGVGGLDEAVSVGYTGNVDAGTATATASYGGDANHAPSSGTASFGITAVPRRARPSACPATVTYTGDALQPARPPRPAQAASTSRLAVDYTANVDAGTATATASFAGDANHTSSGGTATFGITRASSTVSLSCPAEVIYTGWAQTPCTAHVTGAGGRNSLSR